MTGAVLVTASIDPGLSAAAGALLIAVLNELRARSRARAAEEDRAAALAEVKSVVRRNGE